MASNPAETFFSPLERACVITGIALAFLFGIVGYNNYYQELGESPSYTGVLYSSIGLFVLEYNAHVTNIPWQLEVARWLSPLSLSYAAARAIALAMSQQFARLRMSRLRGHAIICGLDSASLKTLESLQSAGSKFIVITSDEQNKYVGSVRKLGGHLLFGNPADPSTLDAASLDRASYLFALLEDDVLNVEIAQYAFGNQSKSSNTLSCAVRIEDSELASALSEDVLFAIDHPVFSGTSFGHDRLAARWLLNEHGPHLELDPETVRYDDIDILILGASQLVEHLVLRFAAIGHYGPDKDLRLHLASASASAVLQRLRESRPALGDILSIKASDIPLNTFDMQPLERIFEDATPNMVYLSAADDRQTLVWVNLLKKLRLKVPVLICDPSSSPLAAMVRNELKELQNYKVVNLLDASYDFDTLICGSQDKLASAIHEAYQRAEAAKGKTIESNTSLLSWETLPESLKEANRNQADHLQIKARILVGKKNYSAEEVQGLLTEDAVEYLASIEHTRWMAEKLLQGWRLTHGEKDIAARVSPSLVPWRDLSDSEKEKDRNAVRQIPKLIDLANVCTDYERR